MITVRQAWGIVAGALAVLCFAIAGSYCVAGCTPAERATIARDDALIIPWTRAVCEVATDVAPPAGYVDLGCTILEGIEGAIPASWADASTARASAAVRVRMPVASAKELAARYPAQVHVP